MKYKHLIIIFLIALVIDAFGAFLKITHMQFGYFNGNVLLFLGMLGKAVAGLLLIIKLIKDKRSNILNQ